MSSPIPNKYSCKFCNFSTSSNEQLSVHVSNQHKEYKCSICHQKFLNLGDIRAHIKEVHLANWTCQICDRSFSSQAQYKDHAKLHLNIASDEPWDELRGEKEKSSELSLEEPRINTTIHIEPPPEMYKCIFCDFTATEENILDNHIRGHAIIEVLQCDYCGICFENKSSLEEHKSTHKKLLYQCAVCDITSPSKKIIIKHLNIEHSPVQHKKQKKTKKVH